AAAAILFGVARAVITNTIQAIVAARLAPEQRVTARARLQAVLNGGFGAGSVIGAAVLVIGRPSVFIALYATCAIASALCAAMFWMSSDLPSGSGRTRHASRDRSRSTALRDRPLLAVTGLT